MKNAKISQLLMLLQKTTKQYLSLSVSILIQRSWYFSCQQKSNIASKLSLMGKKSACLIFQEFLFVNQHCPCMSAKYRITLFHFN